MKIGFTGTREGMTKTQASAFWNTLRSIGATAFHHGMCVGADTEAHSIARLEGIPIVGHPPIKGDLLMAPRPREFLATRQPREYLARNKDIVRETDRLFACPKGPEEKRSGTWSTVRFARSLEKPVTIIYPDGRVVYEE